MKWLHSAEGRGPPVTDPLLIAGRSYAGETEDTSPKCFFEIAFDARCIAIQRLKWLARTVKVCLATWLGLYDP